MLRRALQSSTAAPPVVEPSITSVVARGDVITMASTPASPVLLEPITVRRTGYVMNAGDTSPALTNWDETILLTKRRIIPGGPESSGYVGNEIMPSRVIMAGDTFPNQAGVTNSSTRAPPKIDFRWISTSGSVIGNTASASGSVNSFYTRNGTPVAAVAYVWRDDANNLVRAFCRLPTPYTGHGVTGYSAHQWAVSGVDISSLAGGAGGDGRIRLDWEAYGHFGQLIASSDSTFDTQNASRWFHGTQYFRKNATIASTPMHVYIRPGVPDASPICSTDAALARSRPFGTWQAARDAVDDANFAQYPVLGGPCLDGVIVSFMDTGTGGNVIASPTLSGATICRMAGFRVRPDPLGTWSPRPVLNGFNSQLSTTTNPNSQAAYTIEGFDIVRTGTTVFTNPAAGAASNPINGVVNNRVYLIAPTGGGTFDLGTTGLVGLFGNAYGHCYGYTFPNTGGAAFVAWVATQGTAGLYDCVISDYQNRNLNSFTLICVRALNVGNTLILGTNNGTTVTAFMDAVRIEQATTNTGAIYGVAFGATSNPVLGIPQSSARNCELIVLNSTEANRFAFSNDAIDYSCADVFFQHCTIPSRCAAVRANTLYTDGANASLPAARDHRYSGYTNCVLPPVANKGEWFGASNVPDITREPGYREFGYGVGCKGNFYASHFALLPLGNEIEAQRYPGIHCTGDISVGPNRFSGPYTNPGYVNPLVPTVAGGGVGSLGGDYRHTLTMPTASHADVLFDIAGRAVPLASTRPGAHSGYVP
jgi:hypothetical protein